MLVKTLMVESKEPFAKEPRSDIDPVTKDALPVRPNLLALATATRD